MSWLPFWILPTVVAEALPILAFLVGITIVTPSLRWPFGFIILVGITLISMWGLHHYAEVRFAGAFAIILTYSFVLAAIAYIIGVAWWHSRQ